MIHVEEDKVKRVFERYGTALCAAYDALTDKHAKTLFVALFRKLLNDLDNEKEAKSGT